MPTNTIDETGKKQAGEVYEFTRDQVMDLTKCMNDFVYFSKKITIKTDRPTNTESKIELRPYQLEMAKMFLNHRFTIILSSRQSGKCCFSSTKIKVRNKKTQQIEELTMEEFYKRAKK